jgi:hypothetical protein
MESVLETGEFQGVFGWPVASPRELKRFLGPYRGEVAIDYTGYCGHASLVLSVSELLRSVPEEVSATGIGSGPS